MTAFQESRRGEFEPNPVLQIVDEFWSGFQSGVDQAAMRFALSEGKTIRGWVPAGFRAEVEIQPGIYADQNLGIPPLLLANQHVLESTPANIARFLEHQNLPGVSQDNTRNLLELSRIDPTVPAIRTELLVATTDATLIITTGHPALKDGTALMNQFAQKYEKPCYTLIFTERGEVSASELQRVRAWISENSPGSLNIGGPRESHMQLAGFPIGIAADYVMQKIFLGQP